VDWVLHWISSYGYAAIYLLLMLGIVGLPVPDETLLVYTGYLIYKGTLGGPEAWAAAFLGSATGITVSYVLGRTLGFYSIHHYGKYIHLTEARIKKVHEWFEHLGRIVLSIGYFVPGVRHATALVAGATELDLASFAIFAYTGAAFWVTTFLSLGYLLGDNWDRVDHTIHKYGVAVGAAVIALLAIWWLWRMRADREP
jgi:membrane protein DedA with SNARE-associated domain